MNLIDSKSITTLKKDASKDRISAIILLSFLEPKDTHESNTYLEQAYKMNDSLANALYANQMYKGDGAKKDKTQALLLMSQGGDKNSFNNIQAIINTLDYNYPLFCDYAKKGYELFGITVFIDIIVLQPKKLYELENECKLFNYKSSNHNKLIATIFKNSKGYKERFFNALYLLNNGSVAKAEKILNELIYVGDKIASSNAKYCLGQIKRSIGDKSGDELISEAQREGIVDFKAEVMPHKIKYNKDIINYPGTVYCNLQYKKQ